MMKIPPASETQLGRAIAIAWQRWEAMPDGPDRDRLAETVWLLEDLADGGQTGEPAADTTDDAPPCRVRFIAAAAVAMSDRPAVGETRMFLVAATCRAEDSVVIGREPGVVCELRQSSIVDLGAVR